MACPARPNAHRDPQRGRDNDLVGKRALSDMGNDLGAVSDVAFDPATGALETVVLGDREEPAASLLGAGSFAVIIRAPAD